MVVDFSVEEYFHQLKLMEEQYGQEEDLYSWIYMLLQMAECKKRETAKLEGAKYKPVSIRDVHNAETGGKTIVNPRAKKIKEKFLQKSSYPEFAVFSEWEDGENGWQCEPLGCVEIKKVGGKENILNWTSILERHKSGKQFEIRELEPEYRIWFKEEDQFVGSKINRTLYDKMVANKCKTKFKCVKKLSGRYLIIKEIKKNKVKKDDSVTQFVSMGWFVKKCVHKSKGQKQRKYNGITCINTKGTILLNTLKECDNVNDAEKAGKILVQLISELEYYRKVLYSNGTQFCMFILDNDNQVKIKPIANLERFYNCYKKNKKYSREEANSEWASLQDGLADNQWYDSPKPEQITLEKNESNK